MDLNLWSFLHTKLERLVVNNAYAMCSLSQGPGGYHQDMKNAENAVYGWNTLSPQ